MHITMPDPSKPVADLCTALMLLDHSVEGTGIDSGSTYLWVDFKNGNHEIMLSTSFNVGELEKWWTYTLTDAIARTLVDEELVEDASPNKDATQYAISDNGIRKHSELSKKPA